MRGTRLAAAALALGLGLAACGGSSDSGDAGSGSTGDGAQLKVGLAYDIGGRGDQSFNDSAARGIDRAKQEFGLDIKELEAGAGESEAIKEDRLRQLAEGGYTTVIAVGYAYATSLAKVAPDYTDVQFALVDSEDATGDNIANIVFAEEQGSFLVGVAAALKSTTDKVGFIGGVNTPLIQKFEVGFTAGVKQVKPDAEVQVKYLTEPPDFTGFNDPAKGETAANGMFDAGVDIVYAAAGGSGNGVFKAAKAKGKLGIGVDSDQYNLPGLAEVKDVILTSMIKKVDVGVYDFISSVKDGEFAKGVKVYDLEQGGVDYATSGGKVDDIKAQLDDFKKQIVDGTIKVPAQK
ncbi:BMP family lipoprotein [Actinokineospora pegani]|uniref:BMP family lipoprotein n=1 Tax=Actinokineospora pegani TaxID=2654637 RepID=UPI0018D453C5|nr:BMP family ABC transporter substrate-binding protein [Actinokineospora pegani]